MNPALEFMLIVGLVCLFLLAADLLFRTAKAAVWLCIDVCRWASSLAHRSEKG